MDETDGKNASLDSLIAMREAERAKLRGAITIESAEKITRDAHITSLNTERDMADHRVSTARKRLSEAEKVGSDSDVRVATVRLNQAVRVREHVAGLAEREGRRALKASHDQLGEILEQTDAVTAAEHAVDEALARRSTKARPSGKDDT